MTDPPDVQKMIDENHGQELLAVASLTKLFIEGLNDAVTLPEIHSEAEEATHYLLGCEYYITMFLLMSFKHDVDNDDTPMESRKFIDSLVTQQLANMAHIVMHTRGPISGHTCDRHEAQS